MRAGAEYRVACYTALEVRAPTKQMADTPRDGENDWPSCSWWVSWRR